MVVVMVVIIIIIIIIKALSQKCWHWLHEFCFSISIYPDSLASMVKIYIYIYIGHGQNLHLTKFHPLCILMCPLEHFPFVFLG